MSETNTIFHHEIEMPAITDVKFAEKLDGVFDNINANFMQLANADFVKGASGDSVKIREIEFDDTLKAKLKACIRGLSTNADVEQRSIFDSNGNEISIWDNFDNNPGTLYAIGNEVSDSNEGGFTIVSSLNYIFLDARYANSVMNNIDFSQYDNTSDFSCMVVYDGNRGEFVSLANAFTTIYYDSTVGLCWKVNGCNTGIPVQGMRGRAGIDSKLYIVQCNSYTVNDSGIMRGRVTGLYDSVEGYRNIQSVGEDEIEELNNASALILTPIDDINGSKFFFGSLTVDEDGVYAIYFQNTSINTGIELEGVTNYFKNINLFGNSAAGENTIRGIFVPMDNENEAGEQPVHLFTATSITNDEGSTNAGLKTDVLFTPIENINSVNVKSSSESTDSNLLVNKYLYLKLNALGPVFNVVEGNETYKKYNYIFKYKLTNIIRSTDNNLYFQPYDSDITDGTSNTVGAMRFGAVNIEIPNPNYDSDDPTSNEFTTLSAVLNANNTQCYKTEVVGSGNTYTSTEDFLSNNYNVIDSMPTEFTDRMDSESALGIYRWVLCTEVDEFDIEELYNNRTIAADGSSVYDWGGDNCPFHTIFTTTFNPGITTNIMWFNGIMVPSFDGSDVGIEVDPALLYESVNSGMYPIFGWNNGVCDPVFEFVKFVPVYDNDFSTNNDTALNINYNINITGDENNPQRNITVHGLVNCDDLSVYNLSASGQIKNIYTKDTIVGDKGIQLGKKIEAQEGESTHWVVINDNGNINTDSTITAVDIEASNNITGDEIIARQSIANELFINDTTGKRNLFIGNNDAGDDFKIEISEVRNIDLKRGYHIPKASAAQETSTFNMRSGGSEEESTAAASRMVADPNQGLGNEIINPNPTVPDGGGSGGATVTPGYGGGDENPTNPGVDPSLPDLPEDETGKLPDSGDNDVTVSPDTGIAGDSNNTGNNTGGSIPSTPNSGLVVQPGTMVGIGMGSINVDKFWEDRKPIRLPNGVIVAPSIPVTDSFGQSFISSDVPVIQTDNSNIIVTNADKGDLQLMYYGADSGQGLSNVGKGVTTNEYKDNIGIVESDYVKNFNIHRLSSNLANSSNGSETLFTNNLTTFATHYDRTTDSDVESITLHEGWYFSERIPYKRPPVEDGAQYKDTFSLFARAKDANDVTSTPGYFIDKLEHHYMQKFVIKNNDTSAYIFDTTMPITMEFNKYITYIGIKGECSYGRWPILRKGSIMNLNIYYTITKATDGTTSLPKRIKYLESTYSIDHLETEWYGYDSNGTLQNKNYKMKWRYHAFVVQPSKKVIKPDLMQGSDYLAIVNAYNAGDEITIYAYPSFTLKYKGQNEYNVARGVCSTNFIPYTNIVSAGVAPPKPLSTKLSIVNFGTAINNPDSYIEFDNDNNLGTITYGYNNIGFDAETYNFKSTTVTNDGVVMRAGKYVFGLGYSRKFISHRAPRSKELMYSSVNTTCPAFHSEGGYAIDEPVLFYHEYDPTYYITSKDDAGNNVQTNTPAGGVGTGLEGYAKRTHTIPLKDIFNVIRYIRETVDNETLKKYKLLDTDTTTVQEGE